MKRETLRLLAICHSVIIDESGGEIIYNASSQDEIALVNFARFAGYEYAGVKDNNKIMVRIKNEIEEYKLLNTIEFNSTRKRMSTLVQNPKGEIILYCKGADTIIQERMNKTNLFVSSTWKNLDRYAVIGLRTLVLTKRILDPAYYEEWATKYREASASIENREEKMESLQDEIEMDLELISVTAIEDKLQQDVGATIQILKEAGIQIWVLTGDKIETAINIALSCNLLNDQMIKLIIDGKSEESVIDSLNKGILSLEKNPIGMYALIISGDALIFGMTKPFITHKIMQLADTCKAVVACRVSPKQKQEIVTMVRTYKPTAITLAIGDGANDVNMISAAHVGIGIRGLEGQQAVRASDYAIGEFRFLRRLILYFGRESYRKNTTLICYNFYKNVLLVLPHFWFSFFNDFSGQLLYDSWLYQCFNLFYCSLPIIIYALFDEEYPSTLYIEIKNPLMSVLEKDPRLYEIGFKSKLFNSYEFWSWIINGTYQSAVLVFISFFGIEPYFVDWYGSAKNYNLLSTGMVIFTQCVIIANFKIINFSNSYHPFSLLIIIASILFYILNVFVVNAIEFFDSFGLFPSIFDTAYPYLACILALLFSNLMDCAGNRIMNLFKDNSKVAPLIETDKRLIKLEENDHEQLNSPSYIDKNSTHDNKIFDGVENSIRQNSEISKKIKDLNNSPPEVSRKSTITKFLDDVQEIKISSPNNNK